jgi:hypothetical protein
LVVGSLVVVRVKLKAKLNGSGDRFLSMGGKGTMGNNRIITIIIIIG